MLDFAFSRPSFSPYLKSDQSSCTLCLTHTHTHTHTHTGETTKFISVSRSRIINLAVDCETGGGLRVDVAGAPGEQIQMLFRAPEGAGGAAAVEAHHCTAGQDGKCSIIVGARLG